MRPAPGVLAAFGAHADPVPLPGGEGTTWRAGEVVHGRQLMIPPPCAVRTAVMPRVPGTHVHHEASSHEKIVEEMGLVVDLVHYRPPESSIKPESSTEKLRSSRR